MATLGAENQIFQSLWIHDRHQRAVRHRSFGLCHTARVVHQQHPGILGGHVAVCGYQLNQQSFPIMNFLEILRGMEQACISGLALQQLLVTYQSVFSPAIILVLNMVAA